MLSQTRNVHIHSDIACVNTDHSQVWSQVLAWKRFAVKKELNILHKATILLQITWNVAKKSFLEYVNKGPLDVSLSRKEKSNILKQSYKEVHTWYVGIKQYIVAMN